MIVWIDLFYVGILIGPAFFGGWLAYLWVRGRGYAAGWAECETEGNYALMYRENRDQCVSLRSTCTALREEIDDLKTDNDRLTRELQEARDMARKPLTEEQLEKCRAANGMECPRCGNDDPAQLDFSEAEATEDAAELFQDVECSDCDEKWQLRFALARVVAVEP